MDDDDDDDDDDDCSGSSSDCKRGSLSITTTDRLGVVPEDMI